MDAKNIIQEKIEIIKNEVDFILEKYHGDSDDSAGVNFKNVEGVKQDIEKALWLAVENYETPENCILLSGASGLFCEFYNDGSRFLITIDGEYYGAKLEIDVYTGDLIEGYDAYTVEDFEAFDVSLTGNFEITRCGLHW